MMNPLDPRDRRFLNDLNRIHDRVQKAQNQLSSGKKLLKVSDAPDRVSDLLNARAALSSTSQIKSNLGMLKAEADTAEQSISDAIRAMERARVLGAQGVTGTQTAETRLAIAAELEGVMQQVVAATRASVNGRYLFSGDTDSQFPFSYVPGPPPSVTSYAGSPATRMAIDPSGQSFSVSLAGDTIFQNSDPTRDVFTGLLALHTALAANDESAIGTALQNIESAQDHLNQSLAFYGAIQNRVNQSLELASSQELRLQSQISNAEDSDSTQAILELTQASFQQDAALSSRARVQKRSLFDYLP